MRLDIYFHDLDEGAILDSINSSTELIMASLAELNASLTAVGDQLAKASSEIKSEIDTLTAAVAASGTTTPEIDASVTRLQGLAQALDDLNPDAAAPATP